MNEGKSKNRKENAQRPVKVFREGAIAASVWKRQTSTGFEYLDFSLSRSWKLKSGEKEGYSSNFFCKNDSALCSVIEQASDYIREKEATITSSLSTEYTSEGNLQAHV